MKDPREHSGKNVGADRDEADVPKPQSHVPPELEQRMPGREEQNGRPIEEDRFPGADEQLEVE